MFPSFQVRQVMMGSKLAMPILGKIWDLADIDRDGFLDRFEFTVAMHLVYRALQVCIFFIIFLNENVRGNWEMVLCIFLKNKIGFLKWETMSSV